MILPEVNPTNPEKRNSWIGKRKAEAALGSVDNLSSQELLEFFNKNVKSALSEKHVYSISLGQGENIYKLCRFKGSGFVGFYLSLLDSSEKTIETAKLGIVYNQTGNSVYSSIISPEESCFMRFCSVEVMGSSDGYTTLFLVLPDSIAPNIFGIGLNFFIFDSASFEGEVLGFPKISGRSALSSFVPYKTIPIIPQSKGLPVYQDKESDTLIPTYTSKDLGYDYPSINNIPFTGIRISGTDDRDSFRHITVPAKHKGPTLEDAGPHEWEVLSTLHRSGSGIDTPSTINSEEKLGLARISGISGYYPNSYANFNDWSAIKGTLDSLSCDEVVTADILKSLIYPLIAKTEGSSPSFSITKYQGGLDDRFIKFSADPAEDTWESRVIVVAKYNQAGSKVPLSSTDFTVTSPDWLELISNSSDEAIEFSVSASPNTLSYSRTGVIRFLVLGMSPIEYYVYQEAPSGITLGLELSSDAGTTWTQYSYGSHIVLDTSVELENSESLTYLVRAFNVENGEKTYLENSGWFHTDTEITLESHTIEFEGDSLKITPTGPGSSEYEGIVEAESRKIGGIVFNLRNTSTDLSITASDLGSKTALYESDSDPVFTWSGSIGKTFSWTVECETSWTLQLLECTDSVLNNMKFSTTFTSYSNNTWTFKGNTVLTYTLPVSSLSVPRSVRYVVRDSLGIIKSYIKIFQDGVNNFITIGSIQKPMSSFDNIPIVISCFPETILEYQGTRYRNGIVKEVGSELLEATNFDGSDSRETYQVNNSRYLVQALDYVLPNFIVSSVNCRWYVNSVSTPLSAIQGSGLTSQQLRSAGITLYKGTLRTPGSEITFGSIYGSLNKSESRYYGIEQAGNLDDGGSYTDLEFTSDDLRSGSSYKEVVRVHPISLGLGTDNLSIFRKTFAGFTSLVSGLSGMTTSQAAIEGYCTNTLTSLEIPQAGATKDIYIVNNLKVLVRIDLGSDWISLKDSKTLLESSQAMISGNTREFDFKSELQKIVIARNTTGSPRYGLISVYPMSGTSPIQAPLANLRIYQN